MWNECEKTPDHMLQTVTSGPPPPDNALYGSWEMLDIHWGPKHCKVNPGPDALLKSIYHEQTKSPTEILKTENFRIKERKMENNS